MKRFTLPIALICLAGACHAQLLPDQKLLVIPLQTYDYTAMSPSGGTSWEGVVVFAVDPQTGFTEKARIAHPAVTQTYDYYYAGGTPYSYTFVPAIQRCLWIADDLYTVSDYNIQAHSLTDFTLQGSVDLGGAAKWVYGYGGGGVATMGAPPIEG